MHMNNRQMKRRMMAAGLAAVFALAQPAAILAEDMDAVLDESFDESGATIDTPPAVNYEDDDDYDDYDDDAELIEDYGEESFLVDGLSFEDVATQESEAEQLAAETAALLEGGIVVRRASESMLQTYMDALHTMVNPTGSTEEMEMAFYIRTVMEELGYTVEQQDFHEGFLNEDYVDVPGINLIAERGADSLQKSNGILIVAAHYDAKTNPQEGDALANDKSGAAVLMETARILSATSTDMDICFLFLSGEEDGGYGAENFVAALSEEQRERVKGVIYVGPVGYSEESPYLLGTADAAETDPGLVLQEIGREWDLKAAFAAQQAASENTDANAVNDMEAAADSTLEALIALNASQTGETPAEDATSAAEETTRWAYVGVTGTDAEGKTLAGRILGGYAVEEETETAGTETGVIETTEVQTETDTEPATESVTEESTETETEAVPAEWSFTEDPYNRLSAFTEAQLPGVLFYQYMDGAEVSSDEAGADVQAEPESAAVEESETSAAVLTAGEESAEEALTAANLAKAADILAGAVVQYMASAHAAY